MIKLQWSQRTVGDGLYKWTETGVEAVVGTPISPLVRAIHAACDKLKIRPPKVTEFANCIGVVFRNGDGLKTLITFDLDAKPEVVEAKIAQTFKVKGENQPSEQALAKLKS
jgi:hypothetical protein